MPELLTSPTVPVDHRVVGAPERHAPDRIGGALAACSAIARGERLVVGVERRQVGAERDPRGAGQRREIEQELGRLLVGERQRVGEDQPPFRVGVADLDREPLAADDHVARPHRRAGDRVLDDRDDRP